MDPVKAARREKILEAAHRCFFADGFRGTTMEGIAAEVGMSKVTVYAYFADKEAAFVAVAERFFNSLLCAMQTELAEEGSLGEVFTAALQEKYIILSRDVRSSQHVSELFTARQMARHIVADFEQASRRAFSSRLHNAGYSSADADCWAHIVLSAAQGLAQASRGTEAINEDIAQLVQAIFGSPN